MVDDEAENALRQRLVQEGVAVFEGPKAEDLLSRTAQRSPVPAAQRASPETEDILSFSDVAMSMSQRRVTRGERTVHLSPTEFRLLRIFLRKPREVVSRRELASTLWGPELEVEPRTIDVQVGRLRRALTGPGETNLIRTVRAGGYALDDR